VSSVTVDQFTAEILRSYLVGTVREMVVTTTRTAYSTCFAHGEDFTCALFDADGVMIAQDQGVPVHAGSLGDAVTQILAAAGEVQEGDVFIHNDPYNGGTHQADGLVCRPLFADGALLGFAANRGHWMDVGGMAPGGWSGAALDVVQEGLTLPVVRLVKAGEVVHDVRSMLLRNVRMADQLWGDIQAQIASNIVAERRVRSLVERHGRSGYLAAVGYALEYTRRRFSATLAGVRDGEAYAEDFIEDDGRGQERLKICARVVKKHGRVTVDFAGSAPQVAAPVNCTLACTRSAVTAAIVAVTDPALPLNAGVTECIEVLAPEGSIVNPVYPAPTFGATADPVDRVCETVLAALAQLTVDRVPAGSYATGNNVTGGGDAPAGGQFLWYSYQSGGCGARPDRDGNSAEWHLMANSKNESMEAWESRYPVRFLGYRLVEDSGGAGRWRGGLGTERRLELQAETRLAGISDHHLTGAAGVHGGGTGLPNGFAVERDGTRRTLQEAYGLTSPSKFANLMLRAGDVFVSTQGGGGGYGDPAERDREAVHLDVARGYVTPAAARAAYGYDVEGEA
jgi:N-methylhydantoinase B